MTAKTQLMTTTTLPLSALRIDDKSNVRKIGRGIADQAFVASIRTLGIQMPLIVRQNGTGYVVADGGKRLEAAQALVKAGEWKGDAAVPVIVTGASDAEARELSLALNLIRTDMHPVDAFRAFMSLHTDKEKPLDVDALAQRFGVSTKTVRQRLALGALDDTILDAWRDGKINEDAAEAFTLCPNKRQQARVYAKLAKNYRNGFEAGDVKEELNVNPNDTGRLLNAVGIDAYEARGGKVNRDLFGSDHTVSDEALLKQMIDETLATTCQSLIAAGWAWATSDLPNNRWEFGQIKGDFKPTPAEKKEIARLEARSENEALTYEENEEADDALGNLKAAIVMRSYSKQQKAKAGCFVQIARDGSIRIEYGFTLPPKVKVETTVNEATGEKETTLGKKKVAAPKGAAKLTKALLDRLKEQRETAIKKAIVAHPHKDPFAQLLAAIAADQIRPGSWNAAPFDKQFGKIMEAIDPKVMNAKLHEMFNAKDYFESCGKAFCLAAMTETVNADEARKLSGKKRAEIAKAALANIGKTKWLPRELRTSHYDGPVAKAAPKAKAAKPAKKVAKRVKAKSKTAAKRKSK